MRSLTPLSAWMASSVAVARCPSCLGVGSAGAAPSAGAAGWRSTQLNVYAMGGAADPLAHLGAAERASWPDARGAGQPKMRPISPAALPLPRLYAALTDRPQALPVVVVKARARARPGAAAMPAPAQLGQRAACSSSMPPAAGSPSRHLPPLAPPARRACGAAAARRAVVPLARRYTGRSTDQQQPPPDPNRRMRARRQPGERRSMAGPESSSEFSAEVCAALYCLLTEAPQCYAWSGLAVVEWSSQRLGVPLHPGAPPAHSLQHITCSSCRPLTFPPCLPHPSRSSSSCSACPRSCSSCPTPLTTHRP